MQLNEDKKFLELLRNSRQRLYDFLVLMYPDEEAGTELLIVCFRRFSSKNGIQPTEIDLFAFVWKNLQAVLRKEVPLSSFGRDLRVFSPLEDNLLQKSVSGQDAKPILLKRLLNVETDFRAPVVLKDILKFEDEEVMRILGLRYGVYRHRLHRGRLEVKDSLKGSSASAFSLTKPVGAT